MSLNDKQLELFTQPVSLEPDYFISGNANFPDYIESEYYYYNDFDLPRARSIAKVIPLPKIELCQPPEDGWQLAEVIELRPKGVA